MGKYRRRRVHLKAHDRGDNRHVKGVAWFRKAVRAKARHNGRAGVGQPQKIGADDVGLIGRSKGYIRPDTSARVYEVRGER